MSCCSGASSSRVFFNSTFSADAASHDAGGMRVRIGHVIAGGQPQLVHAAVDLLGQVADALQPLQFGEGGVDMADSDDAGDARHHDHRQYQQEAAKGQLTDRKRERAYPLDNRGKGHWCIETGSEWAAIYDEIGVRGNT